jgi:hypothetical protein
MSKQPTGRRLFEAQRGCFALCGGRLKKLFEKSFLRIFKNFQAVKVRNISPSYPSADPSSL